MPNMNTNPTAKILGNVLVYCTVNGRNDGRLGPIHTFRFEDEDYGLLYTNEGDDASPASHCEDVGITQVLKAWLVMWPGIIMGRQAARGTPTSDTMKEGVAEMYAPRTLILITSEGFETNYPDVSAQILDAARSLRVTVTTRPAAGNHETATVKAVREAGKRKWLKAQENTVA